MYLRFAECERPRLVEHHGINPPKRLQMHSALDDGTEACGTADGTKNCQWRAGRYAAGARDDDDGDRRAHVARDQKRERGGGKGEINQITGQTVGEALDGRPRALSLLDNLDDLAVAAVSADALGAHFQRAGLVDRAGEDIGAGRLLDRHRLACYARLVDEGMASEHGAIDGNAPARRHQNSVASHQLFVRNGAD